MGHEVRLTDYSIRRLLRPYEGGVGRNKRCEKLKSYRVGSCCTERPKGVAVVGGGRGRMSPKLLDKRSKPQEVLERTFACLKPSRITTSAERMGAARKNGDWHSKWGTLKGKEGCSGNDGGNLVQPLPLAQWIRATRGEPAVPPSPPPHSVD